MAVNAANAGGRRIGDGFLARIEHITMTIAMMMLLRLDLTLSEMREILSERSSSAPI
jgi:hypothetical protein